MREMDKAYCESGYHRGWEDMEKETERRVNYGNSGCCRVTCARGNSESHREILQYDGDDYEEENCQEVSWGGPAEHKASVRLSRHCLHHFLGLF